MPFTIPQPQDDVPDGIYSAAFEKVEAVEEGGFDGNGFRKWHFLVDVNGVLMPLTGVTSFSTGPKSKAYEWLTAILGRGLQAGEAIDDPVGKRVTIRVGRNPKGYAKIIALEPLNEPESIIPGVPR